jgi:outer membrane protein insertion porin family
MNHALKTRLAVALAVWMCSMSPVFAETTASTSQSVDLKTKQTVDTNIGVGANSRPQSVTAEQEEAAKRAAEAMAQGPRGTAEQPAQPAETQEASQAAAAEEHEVAPELKPYLDKQITKIIIADNKEIKTEDIAAAVISKPGVKLTEEVLARDLQSIYSMGWFYDLRPTFQTVPEGVEVTYHVLENPKFTGYRIDGNTKISTQDIEKMMALQPDQMINIREVTEKIQQVEAEYKKQGYILARVTDLRVLPDGTLYIQINEGKVEDFKVKGNVKTKDYVILREIRLKKGEPFNTNLARRSMQRIYNLGFFEDVNVRLNPGSDPNSVEMEITVVEANTGTFGIGAGYSDADGFVGMVSLGDKNFRGTGDSIMLRWEFGGEANANYDITYTKPWIDKKETTATLSFYNFTNEYADYDRDADEIARYDKKRIGQELSFARRQGEYVSNVLTFKNRSDKYEGPESGYDTQYYESSYDSTAASLGYPATAAKRRDENFGDTRSIAYSRIYDSRDNVFDPHSGKRNSYTFEWAGLGGDFNFEKVTVDYRYYLKAGGQNVLAFDFGAGYAWGDMPLSQRFSMGGADTLRGYEDDQFRGNSMLRATMEYRMPIVKKVQGVLFIDSGYAWDKRDETMFDMGLIKVGYGLGIRINSPLGPIKLDYGIGEDQNKFHFSFGGQF